MRAVVPDRVVLLGLAGALLVGLMVNVNPVLAVAFVLGLSVVAALVWKPLAVLVVLVLSNAVRWANLPLPLMGTVFLLQKALLFVVLVWLLWHRRGTWFGIAPLMVLSVGAVYSWVLSTPLPGLTIPQTVQSWATLVLVWLAVSLRLAPREWRRLLVAMSWVPSLSLVLGALLLGAGLISGISSPDSTGTVRLSGATIPAYLAALSAAAVVACVVLALSSPGYVVLAALNLVVLMATSGRGAILFALISTVPTIVVLLLSRQRMSSFNRLLTAAGIGVATVLTLVIFVPIVLARTETSGGLNSSGRTEAWSFFLDVASANPLFGRGLGSGPLAASQAPRGILPDTFVAQHSEYVRLILELGYVGLVAFVGAMLVTFALVVRRATQGGPGLFAGSICAGLLVYSGTDNTLTDFQFGVPVGLLMGAVAGWRGSQGPWRLSHLAATGHPQAAGRSGSLKPAGVP